MISIIKIRVFEYEIDLFYNLLLDLLQNYIIISSWIITNLIYELCQYPLSFY